MKKLLVLALTFIVTALSVNVNAQNDEMSLPELRKQLEFLKGKITPLQDQISPLQTQADAITKKIEELDSHGWKYGGDGLLALNLTLFNDWAASAGTERLFGLTGNVNLFANYKKDKFLWDNKGAFRLGYTRTVTEAETQDFIKGIDELLLTSNGNYLLTDKLSINAAVGFQSQFAKGFQEFAEKIITDTEYAVNDSTSIIVSDTTDVINRRQISRFAAPAYINAGLGIKYIPTDFLSITYHPINYKMTFVNIDGITDLYPTNLDLPNLRFGVDIAGGKKTFHTIGSFLNVAFRKDLAKRISFASTLDFYMSYLTRDLDDNNFFNDRTTTNWNNVIGIQISKFISASFDFTLRREYAEIDKWQTRFFNGIGLSAKF